MLGHRRTMRLLAIDCATEACSLALFEDSALIAAHHEVLGRGHAEHLVPLTAALPDKGKANEIWVSLGPGSFTGVRIGLAAARALGLAWGAAVRGFSTLALVAATARQHTPGPVSVCMAGGHGEWFVQDFDRAGRPENDPLSVSPEAAAAIASHSVVAGSRAAERAAQLGNRPRALPLLPDARYVHALPPDQVREDIAPIYGRPPDARLPA